MHVGPVALEHAVNINSRILLCISGFSTKTRWICRFLSWLAVVQGRFRLTKWRILARLDFFLSNTLVVGS